MAQVGPTTLIRSVPADDLRDAVGRASTLSDVLRAIGCPATGGYFSTLRARMEGEGMAEEAERLSRKKRLRDPMEWLREGSDVSPGHAKRILLDLGYLENRCSLCGLQDTWQGQPIVHRLDHINGIKNDWRPENLRMVCPNCDSQLPTFAGRNRVGSDGKRGARRERICVEEGCSLRVSRRAERCREHGHAHGVLTRSMIRYQEQRSDGA